MRKVLPILLAIAIAAPALADVTVSVAEGTANDEIAEVSLAISGDAVVRGLAIKVTITGADLAAIADVTEVMSAFNAYIDYYYSNTGFLGTLPDETYLPGSGAHALADPDAAGVLATLPATTFVISLGALDNSGNQGGVTTGGLLAKVKLSNFAGSDAQVCIEPDALRGGIVGDNLGTVSATGCATIAKAAPQDPCRANVQSLLPARLADYDAYKANGKDPSVWCSRFHCRGDADGITSGFPFNYRVFTADLNILLANWQKTITTADPRADFDMISSGFPFNYRVFTADLNILLANWQKTDAALTNCTLYLP